MKLDYRVIRSPKRRKVTITVERDRTVVVRAPIGLSDDEVARIIDGKRHWVLQKIQHPQKYQSRQHGPGKEVVNGESADAQPTRVSSRHAGRFNV